MSNERLAPDVLLVQTGLSGAVTAIDEDPDSPDGSWLTTTGQNQTNTCSVSFPTPTGDPSTGAGAQEFRLWLRKSANNNGKADDAYIVYLYENGSQVGSSIASGAGLSTSGTLVTATWNAADLSTADGSNVECRVVLTPEGSGSPGGRGCGEVGAIEWNAEYSANVNVGVGLASETDSAQAQAILKQVALGQSTEADSGLSILPLVPVVVNVGLAVETGSGLSAAASKAVLLGQSSESDTAQSHSQHKVLAVGLSVEADSAQGSLLSHTATVGQAVEADTASDHSIQKVVSVGLSAEADASLDVTVTGPVVVPIGLASEVDAGQNPTALKAVAVIQATETDTSQAISPVCSVLVAQAVETNAGLLSSPVKRVDVSQAVETGAAQSVSAGGPVVVSVGIAADAESGFAPVVFKRVAVAQSIEAAASGTIKPLRLVSVGQALSAGFAHPVGLEKRVVVLGALEIDAPLALVFAADDTPGRRIVGFDNDRSILAGSDRAVSFDSPRSRTVGGSRTVEFNSNRGTNT